MENDIMKLFVEYGIVIDWGIVILVIILIAMLKKLVPGAKHPWLKKNLYPWLPLILPAIAVLVLDKKITFDNGFWIGFKYLMGQSMWHMAATYMSYNLFIKRLFNKKEQ